MDRSSHPSNGSQGHSADVKLFLHMPQGTIRLAQAGPNAVKPANGEAIPVGTATVEIIVDGKSFLREVSVSRAARSGQWAEVK